MSLAIYGPARLSYVAGLMPATSPRAPNVTATMISSRWFRDAGDVVTGGTSGSGTVTLTRDTLAECQAWGADWLAWNYPRRPSDTLGTFLPARVAAIKAAGIKFGGTINTAKTPAGTVNGVTFAAGEQLYDLAGNPWDTGVYLRPSPNNSGPPAPDGRTNQQRSAGWQQHTTVCDAAVTGAFKVQEAAYMASTLGADSIQIDDPRDIGIDPILTGSVYSASLVSGFRAWLNANTSSADRTAVGIPGTLPGNWDYRDWLLTNYAAVFTGPGGTPPSVGNANLMDLRVGNDIVWKYSTNAAYQVMKTVFMGWFRAYWRQTISSWHQSVKGAIGSVPLSSNWYLASPDEILSWYAVGSSVFDYAVAEPKVPTWNGSYSVTDRAADLARRCLIAWTADAAGQRSVWQIQPVKPNTVAAGLVITMLRQDMASSWALGVTPMCPWDVYMQAAQGVSVDGYRFMGAATDYTDLFAWVKANSTLFEGYTAAPQVALAYSADLWPDENASADAATWAKYMADIQGVVDAGIPACIVISGADWTTTQPSAAQLQNLPMVVRMSGGGSYNAIPAYLRAPNHESVGRVTWSSLAATMAPVTLSGAGASNCRVLTRYNVSTGKVSFHILNLAVSGTAVSPQSVTVTVAAWVNASGLMVYAPGASPASFTSGSTITVGLWSVINGSAT